MDTSVPTPWHVLHTPETGLQSVAPLKPSRVVYSFPHSGRYYPESFVSQARPKGLKLRASEDAFVDELIGFGPDMPVNGLRAHYPRAFVDVNRNPMELDRRLIRGELPKGALSQSPRVRAGYGVVARCLNAEQDIYVAPLDMTEVSRRIELIHRPYHEALSQMLSKARRLTGQAVLIDWHSMPSISVAGGDGDRRSGAPSGAPDVVIGTLHGESCSAELARHIRHTLEQEGLRVAMNKPYAGGYILEHYGKPSAGTEAVQIEINRAAYMDEDSFETHSGFAHLSAIFSRLTDSLNAL